MQSFLAKCTAVGIVAAGFTLTGDLGRLAERGRRLLEARSVPSETPLEKPVDRADLGPAAAPAPPPSQPATGPAAPGTAWPFSGMPAADAPIGRSAAAPSPPGDGPDAVDTGRFSPGQRLLVWIRGGSDRAAPIDMLALDLIDPAAGEALEHRHAGLTLDDGSGGVRTAPRRVIIVDDGRRISKGSSLRVSARLATGGVAPAESLGTVVAIGIQGR